MSPADGREGYMQAPFNPAQGRNSPRLRGPPYVHPFGKRFPETYEETEEEIGFSQNWMSEVDAERRRQGINPKYTAQPTSRYPVQQNEDDYEEGSDPEGDIGDVTSFVQNTPSRTRVVPEQKPTIQNHPEVLKKDTRFEEPAKGPSIRHRKSLSSIEQGAAGMPPLPQQPANDRFHYNRHHEMKLTTERSRTPQPHIHAPQPLAPAFQSAPFSSKVSSLHESSPEEDQPPPPAQVAESPRPQPGTKRPHQGEDTDFDPETLQKKTMADLDSIAFPTDPRFPTIKAAVDSNGTPLTLSSKLANLTNMEPENQSNLFRSLTDTDREQTAQWFLKKFRTDMQKLMEVRIDRRKIALKYEMEVKQRDRRVQVKREDVEQELGELKKGGNELVRGKSPAK